MSRPRWQLRDAAVGYASRGIPVLPLHYPLPHRGDLQALAGDRQLRSPVAGPACSCRDPGCGQVGKHPLGSLVSHGVKDATYNRARILAWWTRHPQANIGLATGHCFDVLDVDGPSGEQAIRELAAAHGLASSGPAGVVGTTTWPPPAWATSSRPGWRMWTGEAEAAMWSPHPAATPAVSPTSGSPAATSRCRRARCPRSYWPGLNADHRNDPLVPWSFQRQWPAPPKKTATPGRPWPRSSPASPPPPSASATGSCGSRPATSTTWSPPAPSTTARSTKGYSMPLSGAGCWPRSPARPTGPWPRAARSA
jgi:hypothetical protein